MPRVLQTAVLACASQSLSERIALLLASAGISLDFRAPDALAARTALVRFRPDLLIADARLPLQDGVALAESVLSGFAYPVRPAVLLLTHDDAPLSGMLSEAVRLRLPFSDARFAAAIETLRAAPTVFPHTKVLRAVALLDDLGVPEHLGRACLRTACLMCAADERLRVDMRGRLYPHVGEACGCTAAQAERAMRHAIDRAWRSDKVDNQYRVFRDTIDAGRGQPTCREMILRLADILRLEG